MGKHQRKVSSSTVATTIDNSRVRWQHESTILKRLPNNTANAENTNDWPCFVLREAVVYSKDRKRLANPLLPEWPFVVRGILEVDDDGKDCLLNPNVQTGYVEISASMKYSFDTAETLWVSGECGWYEIHPSAKYKAIYEDILEAIQLYHVIFSVFESLDAAEEEYRAAPKSKRKRMNKPTVDLDEILLKYALAVGNGMFRHEAEQRCHKWAPFLINHFHIVGDYDWSNTSFYSWITSHHPGIYKKSLKVKADNALAKPAAAAKASLSPKRPEPPTRSSSERSSQARGAGSSRRSHGRQDVDMDDDSSDLPLIPAMRKISKIQKVAKSAASTPQPAPTKPAVAASSHTQPLPTRPAVATPSQMENPAPTVQGYSPARATPDTTQVGDLSPSDILLTAVEEIAAKVNKPWDKIKHQKVCAEFYYGYQMNKYLAGGEVIAYFSKELLPRLDAKWHPSPFYAWLKEQSTNPARLQPTLIPVDKIHGALVRRKPKNNRPSLGTSTPSQPPPFQIRRTRQPEEDGDSDSDDDGSSTGRRAAKGGLRLHSASKKRTAADAELLDDDSAAAPTGSTTRRGRPARKSAKTWSYFQSLVLPGDEEEESQPQAEEDEVDNAESASTTSTTSPPDEGEEDLDKEKVETVRVVAHAEKLPSLSPSGPNGTWVCDQEDCGYVVRAAEEPDGRALVTRHFREHEARMERVALAVAEANRRGRMPINNLLAKIQEMGKKTMAHDRQAVEGAVVPPPIKRRLLI